DAGRRVGAGGRRPGRGDDDGRQPRRAAADGGRAAGRLGGGAAGRRCAPGRPPLAAAARPGSLGYLLAYVVASLAAFAVVVLLARHHPAGEEHTLDAYRGLARSERVASPARGRALACLAGLPPGIMGLVAKVVAVRPLVDTGQWVFAVVAAV